MANTEVKLEQFQRILQKQLFPENAFYKLSKLMGNASVDVSYIPQSSGNAEPVLGGLTSGYDDQANNETNATKADVAIRANNKKSYTNTIIRPPKAIVFEELQEASLSYNKASQYISEQGENLNTGIANYMAIAWQPTVAANIIATTGLDSSGTEIKRSAAQTTGAKGGYAGLVKRFQYEDWMALQTAINKQNVRGGTWYALLTPEFEEDLMRIPEFVEYQKSGIRTPLKDWEFGKWGKVTFLSSRQNDRWNANILYDITAGAGNEVPVAYAGALNVNCQSAMLVWNDKLVERQEGGIKTFSDLKNPEYMGDIYNFGARLGGTSTRLDEKGVIAFYEAQTV